MCFPKRAKHNCVYFYIVFPYLFHGHGNVHWLFKWLHIIVLDNTISCFQSVGKRNYQYKCAIIHKKGKAGFWLFFKIEEISVFKQMFLIINLEKRQFVFNHIIKYVLLRQFTRFKNLSHMILFHIIANPFDCSNYRRSHYCWNLY